VRHQILASIVIVCALLVVGSVTPAQQPPPIPGVTGTLAPEGCAGDKAKEGAHTAIAGAADAIRHLFQRRKGDAHDPESTDQSTDVLKDFTNGTHVVVHYVADAAGEPRERTGVVTQVDRKRKAIQIRFADGTGETLQLSTAVATDADNALTADALVYHTSQNGQRLVHYFRFPSEN